MNEKKSIFVVEDCDEDFELLQRLFSSAKITAALERALSGNSAMERLARAALDSPPLLVFTDLSMPDGDGFEFLAWAKTHPALRETLLVVLSSTRRGADIDRAYGLGAHFFLSKFPTAPMLAALCSAAEKKDMELRARLAPLQRESGVRF